MREILFRGQTRKKGQRVWMNGTPVDGEWVYGGVLQGVGDFSIIYGGKNPNDLGDGLEKWCVYTDTVGQYTGLCDKNGKKIFEGDIIRIEFNNTVACVEFEGMSWQAVISKYKYRHRLDELMVYEVIGNVHDNKELLNED